MSHKRLFIISVFIIVWLSSAAQNRVINEKSKLNLHNQFEERMKNNFLNIGDSVFMFYGVCKSNYIFFKHNSRLLPNTLEIKTKKEESFIKIHGNILYNFSYRSYIDTPFAQNDLNQQTVQTNFNFLIKDKYPVKMTVTNRSSNSPYFKNSTDVNFQFTSNQLVDNIKTDLKVRMIDNLDRKPIDLTERKINEQKLKFRNLQEWIKSSSRLQEFVDEKEKSKSKYQNPLSTDISNYTETKTGLGEGTNKTEINSSNRSRDGYKKNKSWVALEKELTKYTQSNKKKNIQSSDSNLVKRYKEKKLELAMLADSIKQEEASISKMKRSIQDSTNKIKREINDIKTSNGLFAFMKKNGLSRQEFTKMQKILLAINKFGIGRNWIDYSELTAKNVTLNGLNIESNPVPFYFAFAAGKLNYQFRDYIIKNNKSIPNQSLYIARVGVGQKEKNNFIITFYNGTKSELNYNSTISPEYSRRILGLSFESKIVINENSYFIAEVAKSSYNSSYTYINSSRLLNKALDFKNRTNEAYSIKFFGINPVTRTKLNAYYKKSGNNFESFNLYATNINQDAWMVRLNQSFWKQKFLLDGAIRKNDFNSPLAAPSFNTKAIFKSLQVSLRIPKYPFISIGYYPSSQLSVSKQNILMESQYNTLNGIASYNYLFKKIGMNTDIIFTKFYNSSSDSGFIYYNSTSYTINHTIFMQPFTLQTGLSNSMQPNLHLFTFEQALSYQFRKLLSITAGLKWNRLNASQNLFGAKATLNLYLRKLGVVQVNYDKAYLPRYDKTLVPVDIGRLTFYREF